MRKPRPPRVLAAPARSDAMLVEIAPRSVGMFRFLLEGYDHLAGFTVLNRRTALLKVFFSPHQREEALTMLEGVCRAVDARLKSWPTPLEEPCFSRLLQDAPPAGLTNLPEDLSPPAITVEAGKA